jgi:hypothetical protein
VTPIAFVATVKAPLHERRQSAAAPTMDRNNKKPHLAGAGQIYMIVQEARTIALNVSDVVEHHLLRTR